MSAACASATASRSALRVREGVEDVALRVGVEQRLGLVLAVEVHQERAELAEDRRGGRAAVDPGARAALGRDLAAHDDARVLDVEAERFDLAPGAAVEALEGAFDDRLGGAGTNAAARGPLAEEKSERVDEHGLAGAGLTGEDVEAGAEVEGDVGDGGEVADAEFGEHGQAVRRSGGRAVGHCVVIPSVARDLARGPDTTSVRDG